MASPQQVPSPRPAPAADDLQALCNAIDVKDMDPEDIKNLFNYSPGIEFDSLFGEFTTSDPFPVKAEDTTNKALFGELSLPQSRPDVQDTPMNPQSVFKTDLLVATASSNLTYCEIKPEPLSEATDVRLDLPAAPMHDTVNPADLIDLTNLPTPPSDPAGMNFLSGSPVKANPTFSMPIVLPTALPPPEEYVALALPALPTMPTGLGIRPPRTISGPWPRPNFPTMTLRLSPLQWNLLNQAIALYSRGQMQRIPMFNGGFKPDYLPGKAPRPSGPPMSIAATPAPILSPPATLRAVDTLDDNLDERSPVVPVEPTLPHDQIQIIAPAPVDITRIGRIPHKRGSKGKGKSALEVYGKLSATPRLSSIVNAETDAPIFTYNKFGQWNYHLSFTTEQLRSYFEVMKGRVKLWVQNHPAQDVNRQPGGAAATKCRWADCPSRTILKGWFRVCIDEWPEHTGRELDPFHYAGCLHLWCFERMFDPVQMVEFGFAPDLRIFEKEERNPMSLVRDHRELRHEYNVWMYGNERAQFHDPTRRGKRRSRSEYLGRTLTQRHLDLETRARTATRHARGGASIDKHLGDLRVYLELRRQLRQDDAKHRHDRNRAERAKRLAQGGRVDRIPSLSDAGSDVVVTGSQPVAPAPQPNQGLKRRREEEEEEEEEDVVVLDDSWMTQPVPQGSPTQPQLRRPSVKRARHI